ncbi:hypothetical protein ABHI18_010417 [Aspergillus niger]
MPRSYYFSSPHFGSHTYVSYRSKPCAALWKNNSCEFVPLLFWEYNWFKRKDRNGCPVALSLGETVATYDTEEPDKSPLHAISESRRFIDNNHGMIPRANDSASSPVVTMLPGL